jgi:hypothetical protein
MSNFLGMQVTQGNYKIELDQSKAIQDLIELFKYEKTNERSASYKTETSNLPCDRDKYQSAVGKLLYISTCARPDICFACSTVGQFNSDPKIRNWNDVTHVVRYSKGTTGLHLTYQRGKPMMEIFCDASYNNVKGERLSGQGMSSNWLEELFPGTVRNRPLRLCLQQRQSIMIRVKLS